MAQHHLVRPLELNSSIRYNPSLSKMVTQKNKLSSKKGVESL